MKKRLIFWPLFIAIAVGLVIFSRSIKPAGPVAIGFEPVETLSVDNRQITSFGSYANLRSKSPEIVDRSLAEVRTGWHPGGFAMLIESLRFQRSPSAATKILALLEQKSGQTFERDLNAWLKWNWSQNHTPHPEYAQFKRRVYSVLDERFAEYFEQTDNARIRLEEIVWGGVVRDGIPPLKDPQTIAAGDATYLEDSNVVFGVILNGDVRCYPKRILAWHEMFKDTIGGTSVCGVY